MRTKGMIKLMPLSLLLLTIACGKSEQSKKVEVDVTKVKVATVSLQEVEQLEVFTSTVQPLKKNHIASSTPNRIKRIYVEIGDHVRAGQKIADMDQTTLATLRSQLENNERDYERVLKLFNIGGASKQQVDQLKTQIDVQKATLIQLEENATLVSPIGGIVTARNYDAGDMTGQQPVVTVMQMAPIKLIVNVNERFYTHVKKGQSIKITSDLYPDQQFAGKVSLIYPTIDETTRSFSIEVQVANNDNKLRPGMFTRSEISFGKTPRIVVPDRAVIKQVGSNERHVFIVNGTNAQYATVLLGRRMGNQYEVISGISEGDQVIVEGNTRLVDGAPITVIK